MVHNRLNAKELQIEELSKRLLKEEKEFEEEKANLLHVESNLRREWQEEIRKRETLARQLEVSWFLLIYPYPYIDSNIPHLILI